MCISEGGAASGIVYWHRATFLSLLISQEIKLLAMWEFFGVFISTVQMHPDVMLSSRCSSRLNVRLSCGRLDFCPMTFCVYWWIWNKVPLVIMTKSGVLNDVSGRGKKRCVLLSVSYFQPFQNKYLLTFSYNSCWPHLSWVTTDPRTGDGFWILFKPIHLECEDNPRGFSSLMGACASCR